MQSFNQQASQASPVGPGTTSSVGPETTASLLKQYRGVKGGGLLYGGLSQQTSSLNVFFSIGTPLSANIFLFADIVSENNFLFAETLFANKQLLEDCGVQIDKTG